MSQTQGSAMKTDADGFFIMHSFGWWELTVSPDFSTLVLCGPNHYWIDEPRFHENHWIDHISRKHWASGVYSDVADDLGVALEFVRTLRTEDRETICKYARLFSAMAEERECEETLQYKFYKREKADRELASFEGVP